VLLVVGYFLFKKKATSSKLGELPDDPDLLTVLNIEDSIQPEIKAGKFKEVGPRRSSIFAVKFLKPEYCAALVRVLEKYGDWTTKSQNNYGKGMTLPLDFIPEIEKNYSDAVRKYIYPLCVKLFPTFNPTHHDEVYILRYRAGHAKQIEMEAHYDAEPLACMVTLNRDFKGGGTFFPNFGIKALLTNPGEMIIYPGGLGHLHGGNPISAGRRYLLLHALYDRRIHGTKTAEWDEGEPQHER